MSLTRRTLALLAAVVVVGAGILVLVVPGDGDPGLGLAVASSPAPATADGEGLMGSRPSAVAGVLDERDGSEFSRLEPMVEVVGPGSRVFDHVDLRLDGERPVRIRQYDSDDYGDESAVAWAGYVAELSRTSGGAIRPIGRWRRVGPEGIVVRPGSTVRLRTRFDIARTSRCAALRFEDAPRWFVRPAEDDGAPWRALRPDGGPGGGRTAADVHTGMHGPVLFRTGSRCPLDAVRGVRQDAAVR
jgi:hypothetical protein